MPSPSNNPVASRFTRSFLRALSRINRPRQHRSTVRVSASQRRRRVRNAADASLALAVGPRRAWSRAVLRRARGPIGGPIIRRRRIVKRRRARVCMVRELEKVVPGGEKMDVYSLLDETAHYIECLKTQVQVMNAIATLFSTTSTPSISSPSSYDKNK